MIEVKGEKYRLRILIGTIISLAALAGLFWFIDFREAIYVLKQVRPIWLIPVLLMLFVSLMTRASAWRTILQDRISLWQSFLIVNAGYFVNTIFPFRLGEITRAFLLLPSGFSFWDAFPTIILERMFDLLFAVSLFLVGLPFALGFSQGVIYPHLMGVLALIGLVALYLMVRYRDPILLWLEERSFPWRGVQTWVTDKIRLAISGLEVLKKPNQILITIFYMSLSWGIALIYQYILLRAFIPEAKFIWAVFALGALALGVSVPSSPGNIGIYEASLTLALTAFGVEGSVAITYALTSHLLSLGITTLFGAFAVVNKGYQLGDVLRFNLEEEKEEKP
jgi:uncharacterized protein (TIRG00374 family)